MINKIDYNNLTVVIAAYNEELTIRSTLQDLKRILPEARIIVVNDGSKDNTEYEAKVEEGITLINNDSNRGMGAALKKGMRLAKTSVMAWYDADGQHRPEDLLKVAAPVLSGEKDVVIGVRQKGSDNRIERVPGKAILKWMAQLVAGTKIPDLNSGLRCFRTEVIRRYFHLLPDGFSASSISSLLMIKRGYRIGYIPIITNPRKGKSSVKIFRDGFLTLHLLLRTLILFEAFKFFTTLSLLQIIPGLIYGIFLAFSKKLGFPTLSVMVVTSGVLTFFMGIISEQISELRKEKFEVEK